MIMKNVYKKKKSKKLQTHIFNKNLIETFKKKKKKIQIIVLST